MTKLKRRSDLHLERKFWHMGGVFLMFLVYTLTPYWVSMSFLIVFGIVGVTLDFLRLNNPKLNQHLMQVFGPFMRKSEMNQIAGSTYLLVGVTLVALLARRDVVQLTLLFLAFADPIASYFGIRFGKDKIIGNKSLQGTLAAFVVCALATFLYIHFHQTQFQDLLLGRLFLISLIGGVIGCFAELIPLGKLDDNFTLPVLSAVGLTAVFNLFGI